MTKTDALTCRMVAVLKGCQSKLNCLSSKKTELSLYRDEILLSNDCAEVKNILDHQQKLRHRLLILEKALVETKCFENKKQFTTSQDEKHQITKKLQEYSKLLNRRLKEHPSVICNIDRITLEIRALANDINSLHFAVENDPDKLSNTDWDILTSRSTQKIKANLVERESSLTSSIKKLQDDLEAKIDSHGKSQEKIQNEIIFTKQRICDIQNGTDASECNYRAKICEQRDNALNTIHDEQESIMNKISEFLIKKLFFRLFQSIYFMVHILKYEIFSLALTCIRTHEEIY